MVKLMKNIILSTGLGISANILLLVFHIFVFLLDHRPKPTDLIICHLSFVHLMKLFTELSLLSAEVLESLSSMNDVECKALFCLNRVTRGLSICTTCFLSVLQVITISPSTSWLARFKSKCTKYIFHSFVILWFLSLSLSSNCVLFSVASFNVTQTNLLNVGKHCSLSPMDSVIRGLILALTISRDVYFVGVTLLSSAYMVILLSRHQRRCQHLHITSFSSRASPEKRATQTVLLLVSFFVVVYWVDIIISFSSTMLWTYDPVVLDFQRLLSNVYATVSALVLINSDKRMKMCFRSVEKLQTISNSLFIR
uniref:Vomeronasal type-1 receptor n=1 Tax=Neovison vison TaxID=452646 RepID=A0A8C7AI22_NEOVI